MSPSTTTSQVLSTHDLRSHGVESKRDYNDRHKWQHGQKKGPGRGELAHGVPAKPEFALTRATKRESDHNNRKLTKHARVVMPSDEELHTDSSCDEPDYGLDAIDAADAAITYSFDHPRGATQGSQILSSALAQAVERFESAVTDRIVQEEYEVLDAEGGDAPRGTKAKGRKMKMKMPVSSATGMGMVSPRDEVEYEFV